jgi:hypothetical protein
MLQCFGSGLIRVRGSRLGIESWQAKWLSKKGEEKILCFKELSLGLEAFLVLGRLLGKN